ncbi:hypothetical protein [Robertmurraya sp. Marseille-Q9965]
MTIEQLKTALDQLEQMMLLHSLQPLAIEELEQLQEKVKELKESFLLTCFEGNSVAELEEIRFKLVEICYSISISLKEQLHQNVNDDIRKLEGLYRTA